MLAKFLTPEQAKKHCDAFIVQCAKVKGTQNFVKPFVSLLLTYSAMNPDTSDVVRNIIYKENYRNEE